MKRNIKLFVWTDVLTDYTSGIMFALAETADEARSLIRKEVGYESSTVDEDLKKEPSIYTDKIGFKVWGGG
jgi:hypothetical protein